MGQIVPFWLKYSRDEACGGYFNALTQTGQAIDTDKTIVLQAQQVWSFAYLYTDVDAHPAWLDHARHGAGFLAEYAHGHTLDCYALVDRRGRPVALATDVVPDSTVAMAYARLYKATRDDQWAMLAKQTLTNLLGRRTQVRTEQVQALGGLRTWRHLSEPVTLLKALLEMKDLLSEADWKDTMEGVTQELFQEFLDKRLDRLRENVGPEGTFLNTPEGRRRSPGLTFEVVNYLLDLSDLAANRKMALQAVMWCLEDCKSAWDEFSGGLLRWVDLKGEPGVWPEADQRLASVHLEALAALGKGYFYTRHPDAANWFKRIHDYVFKFFPDSQHQAWHLLLDRAGKPVLTAKATPAEGCYHFVRCMTEAAQMLGKSAQQQPLNRSSRSLQ